ncbi:MAG: hypothetical protein OEZ02_01485 [Anaerolineae bacterium]|nr:hypothetical protein [Anaerolineae bacterium]
MQKISHFVKAILFPSSWVGKVIWVLVVDIILLVIGITILVSVNLEMADLLGPYSPSPITELNEIILEKIDHIGRCQVHQIEYSPDGSQLIVATGMGLWIYSSSPPYEGRLVETNSPAISISFSPDGSRIAIGNSHGIEIWSFEKEQYIQSLDYPIENVLFTTPVKWSPDGKYIASDAQMLYHYEAWVWDADGGVLVSRHEFERGIDGMSWAPEGNRLAVNSGGKLFIWTVSTDEKTVLLDDTYPHIRNISWSPDGRYIALNTYDNTFLIWSLALEAPLVTLLDRSNQENSRAEPNPSYAGIIGWSPDSSKIALLNNEVRVWSIPDGDLMQTLGNLGGFGDSLSWSPDGTQLSAAGGWMSDVRVWSVANGETLHTFEEHYSWLDDLSWSPDGTLLAFTGHDKIVRLWSPVRAEITATLGREYPSAVNAVVQWSPNGEYLAVQGIAKDNKPAIQIWSVLQNRIVQTLPLESSDAQAFSWSADGSKFAVGTGDGEIWIWDFLTGEWIKKIDDWGRDDIILRDIAWSPDGKSIAAGATTRQHTPNVGIMRVWDVENGDLLLSLSPKNMRDAVEIAWSPDGSMIALGSHERKRKLFEIRGYSVVRIFSSKTGRLIHTTAETSEMQIEIAWSPDGKFIAYSAISYVLIYSLEDKVTSRFDSGEGNISGINWSPDGGQIDLSHYGGTISFWLFDENIFK